LMTATRCMGGVFQRGGPLAMHTKKPATLADGGPWENTGAAYLRLASSRSLAALITSSEMFFGQAA
jgi:hypothetical protein